MINAIIARITVSDVKVTLAIIGAAGLLYLMIEAVLPGAKRRWSGLGYLSVAAIVVVLVGAAWYWKDIQRTATTFARHVMGYDRKLNLLIIALIASIAVTIMYMGIWFCRVKSILGKIGVALGTIGAVYALLVVFFLILSWITE